MKILEKEIRMHTGGGCELSSITIEYNGYIYICIYTNTDGYTLYRGKKDLVNKLYNTEGLLEEHFIEGQHNYYDLVTVDWECIEKFEYLEGDYEEPSDEYNNNIVEKYLLGRMKKYIEKI